MSRVDDIVSLLEKRILHGDYAARELPTETRLAAEMGASRMTARKAVLRLLDRGYLVRQPNGRVYVSRRLPAQRMRVAFLGPAHSPLMANKWRIAVEREGARRGIAVRPVDFVHWDDPIIGETLEGFDGVFLLPSSDAMPDALLERLRTAPVPLVMLDKDLSHLGIRSIDTCPPRFYQQLMDHLAELGHRRIDLLNTQPLNDNMRRRIEQWQIWRCAKGIDGELFERHVEPYGNAMERACEVTGELLDSDRLGGTALLCTTSSAAMGAMRAVHERGLRVGRDLSVSGWDDEGWSRFCIPSLTSLSTPPSEPYVAACLESMARGGEWVGPLLTQATDVPLFKGESTGRAPVKG